MGDEGLPMGKGLGRPRVYQPSGLPAGAPAENDEQSSGGVRQEIRRGG